MEKNNGEQQPQIAHPPNHLLAFTVVYDTATQTPIYLGTVSKSDAVMVLNNLIARDQAAAMLKEIEEANKPKRKAKGR